MRLETANHIHTITLIKITRKHSNSSYLHQAWKTLFD